MVFEKRLLRGILGLESRKLSGCWGKKCIE
jgi:hypothetical protein